MLKFHKNQYEKNYDMINGDFSKRHHYTPNSVCMLWSRRPFIFGCWISRFVFFYSKYVSQKKTKCQPPFLNSLELGLISSPRFFVPELSILVPFCLVGSDPSPSIAKERAAVLTLTYGGKVTVRLPVVR